MVLSKSIERFTKEFDFTEGIVSGIKWDSNLMDLLVTVYYFWGEYKNKDLTIRFKNCRKTKFIMPKAFENIPKNESKNYIYSWYTITGCDAKEDNGVIACSIKTIDDAPRWLTVECEEIWVESEWDTRHTGTQDTRGRF